MRKILSLLTISLLVFFTACDMNTAPEFDDSDAFVAFDNAAMSIAEDEETILIPVTLASVKGLSATVSFEIVDGTAKQGENYNLVNETTTLTFNAQNRTQFIEVSIIEIPDVFTGDLRFSIKLNEDGTVKPSVENTCTVTIKDLDHPLSAFFGDYSVAAINYFNGSTYEYSITVEKDPEDVSVLWFYNLAQLNDAVAATGMVYGVVDKEAGEIAIPAGQLFTGVSLGGDPVYLWHLDVESDDVSQTSRIILKFNEEDSPLTLTIEENTGFGCGTEAGSFYRLYSGFTAVKQ